MKTEQNEAHVPTAYDGEHMSALITFKFASEITHTPGILTPGDFHPDRSDDHVVPRGKSPDVMVRVSRAGPSRCGAQCKTKARGPSEQCFMTSSCSVNRATTFLRKWPI